MFGDAKDVPPRAGLRAEENFWGEIGESSLPRSTVYRNVGDGPEGRNALGGFHAKEYPESCPTPDGPLVDCHGDQEGPSGKHGEFGCHAQGQRAE